MLDGLSLQWPWHPGTIIFLALLSLLYILALFRARQSALQTSQENPVKARHVILFFTAILVMAVILLTPIDTIGRTQLFSVHMAQAVILVTLCSPLILFASPAALLQPLIELPVVSSIVRVLTRPLVASLLFNLTFLIWHTPLVYDEAVTNSGLYSTLLLSVFCCSLLNWWPLIGSVHELRRMSYPIQMLYAFFDGQPVDIFAFVLVFSGVPIYANYHIPPQLGLSPFADQAVGGALLLVPGLIDLVVMTPLFFRWLGQIEQRTKTTDEERVEAAEQEELVLDEEDAEAEQSVQ